MGKTAFVFDLLEYRLLDVAPRDIGARRPVTFEVLSPEGGLFSFRPDRLPHISRGEAAGAPLKVSCDEDVLFSLLTDPAYRWQPGQFLRWDGDLSHLSALLSAKPAKTLKPYQR